jgi:ubiquitin C-terminal hydrolase
VYLWIFSALQLSREIVEQIIDESDVAQRNSFDEPVGLKNIGNTCWFNSVVQAVYALPNFRRLILNYRYSSSNRSLTDSVGIVIDKHTHMNMFDLGATSDFVYE